MNLVLIAGRISEDLRKQTNSVPDLGVEFVECTNIFMALEAALTGDYRLIIIDAVDNVKYAIDFLKLFRSLPDLARIRCIISANNYTDLNGFQACESRNVEFAFLDRPESLTRAIGSVFMRSI